MREELVYGNDKFVVYGFQGSLYMYWRNERRELGHDRLASASRSVFEKKYKSSFDKWFEAVQKREKATMLSYLKQARVLLAQAETIRVNNDF